MSRWEVFYSCRDGSGLATLSADNQDEALKRATELLAHEVDLFIDAIGRIGGSLTHYVRKS